MSDVLQIMVVTAAASVAMVALVRPYVRRRSADSSAACSNCASGARCATPAPAAPTLIQITRRSSAR